MNVAAILREKGDEVHVVSPSDQLSEAARSLDEKKIGALVVVDRQGRVRGVLSERDLARAIARKGAEALEAPVSEAMTRDVVTASLADTLENLMARMTDRRVRHLPVIAQGRLAGLVSIGDVVKWKISLAELETRAMRDYIAAG